MVIYSKKPLAFPPEADAVCYAGSFALKTCRCCSPGKVWFPSFQLQDLALLEAPNRLSWRSLRRSFAASLCAFLGVPGWDPSSSFAGEGKRAVTGGNTLFAGLLELSLAEGWSGDCGVPPRRQLKAMPPHLLRVWFEPAPEHFGWGFYWFAQSLPRVT